MSEELRGGLGSQHQDASDSRGGERIERTLSISERGSGLAAQGYYTLAGQEVYLESDGLYH